MGVEPELARQRVVREVLAAAGEGEQGQLAQLEGLDVGEGREGGLLRGVGLVGAVGEDLEEGVVGCVFGGGGEGSDGGGLEELGEDVGVWGGGGAGDEVGGCSGGCRRLGEREERLFRRCISME